MFYWIVRKFITAGCKDSAVKYDQARPNADVRVTRSRCRSHLKPFAEKWREVESKPKLARSKRGFTNPKSKRKPISSRALIDYRAASILEKSFCYVLIVVTTCSVTLHYDYEDRLDLHVQLPPQSTIIYPDV